MKKSLVTIPLLVMVLMASPAAAEPMNLWHLALKFSSIEFVGSQGDRQRLNRDIYAALEAYVQIAPGVYAGGELGSAVIENDSATGGGGTWWASNFEFSNIELNVKQVLPLTKLLDVEGGLGVALVEAGDVPWYDSGSGYTDNYYAGQVFTGLNLGGQRWYGGLNLKYQQVENGYENWRVGGHVGYRFE